MVARLAFCVLVVLSAATCGTCGSSSVSSTNHCVETRLCLTISGPLAGTTGRLLADPDCIVGAGLDVQFTTTIAGRESTLEIDVTDPSLARTVYKAGTYTVGPNTGAQPSASLWITPDQDVTGYPGGWYTDASGTSGSITLGAKPGGTVNNVVAVPKQGSGSLTIHGTFSCT